MSATVQVVIAVFAVLLVIFAFVASIVESGEL